MAIPPQFLKNIKGKDSKDDPKKDDKHNKKKKAKKDFYKQLADKKKD